MRRSAACRHRHPSGSLPRQTLSDCSRALTEAAAADPRRIGFVASCGWSHAHGAEGPYGSHQEAALVDADVVAAVEANDAPTYYGMPGGDMDDARR